MPPQLPRSPAHVATAIKALQASSIVLASTATGLSAAISFIVIPRFLDLPTHSMIRQFNRMVATTGKVMPPLLLLPGLLNAALAALTYRYLPNVISIGSRFNTSSSSGITWWPLPLWKIYAIAAGLTFLQTPWTYGVMAPLNRMMGARGEAIATRVAGYNASSSSSSSSSSSKRRSTSHVSSSSSSSSDRSEREAADRVEYYAVKEGEMTSHAVVDRWGLTNLFRPAVSLMAAGVGAYAAIW